ncbi:DUF29 domain-containing protein [Aerosakkonemataceae cyanobacterium BLCC-F50]|uniref:DUF29 domain-containing protein n=1 Tax=Floridaenema flaviceps BLCC-F50 TaxID=3153642 RepID=A0ABV4XMJ3_9CYAN
MNHSIANATYETDFYAWLLKSAELLRRGEFAELDLEQIAEELEGMARSDKRQLVNRLAVLLAHLLKWQYQPEKRSKSWQRTIREQRKRISLLLEDSPSLKYEIEEKLTDAYEIAVLSAANETGLDEDYFPESCEYALDEVLDSNFYPD